MDKYNAQNGDIIDAFNQRVNNTGVSPTLTTRPEGFKTAILPVQNYRIRKLTPRECWRLMGVKDEQYDKLHDISNTQLYKMAGNSIVVDVLMGIFKNLFLSDEGTSGQLTLF
jgi:DNA (cytosine-5)-methyltransferase 1